MNQQPLKANSKMIDMWAKRDKCWMCKHRFGKPVILPTDKPVRGKLQPHYNASVLFHLYDTHGMDPEVVTEWIFGSVYGLELTEVGVKYG